jgi:acyl carrier protein
MQNLDDLQQQLFQILEPFVPEGFELKADTDLVADLNLDSMKVMDIVAEVEDAFDILIPLNILPDIRTVEDFAAQLQKIIQ